MRVLARERWARALLALPLLCLGITNVGVAEEPKAALAPLVTTAAADPAIPVTAVVTTPAPAPPDTTKAEWKPDTGDTAWVLVSTGLVLLMTPGLAFFYAGMVRRKNALGTMMQSWILMGLISIEWVVLGYSMAFADGTHYVGGLRFALLPWDQFKAADPLGYAPTIPHPVFMSYQMMFAIITPALIFGAVADRMKFKAMLIFSLLWAILVYNPLAHMVWGSGGLLRGVFENGQACKDGSTGMFPAMDFAGGTVVHISSGVAALVCCLVLGPRFRYAKEAMPPHSMVLAVIGAGLLWVGWFGFNGGSALGANGLAATALTATHLAAAAATLSWVFIEWLHRGKPSVLGAISGAVAGLVVITPAAGFVEPITGVWMGLLAGAACYTAVGFVKSRFGYDDSLDAFGVHGVGGVTGALLTGVFATTAVNAAGTNGLLHGNPGQMLNQAIAAGVTIALSAIGSYLILKLVDATVGLRVDQEDEIQGLDLTQHGEVAYNL
ncbi:MAG: ammonium transporter [Planctomycetota bacterium]|nr:ammonium transporter [Planctomycetota bacterium]